MTLADWLTVIEVAATLAFAVSGLIVAAREKLDVVGAAVVAIAASFGGGTVRDVLLSRRPFFWVEHQEYLWAVLILAAISWPLFVRGKIALSERMLVVPDALGLGLFSATGVGLALDAGMPLLVAALMGVVTAVFGGVVRDVLCNRVPAALYDHQPYALCAFAGGWLTIGCVKIGVAHTTALLVGAALASALRLIAWWRDWRLPGWPEP
jgi:uncharacterized membrane protein YeiH